MNKNKANNRKANNSKPSMQQKEDNPFVKILRNLEDGGASVVYVFRTQRIKFTKETPNGEYYVTESKQITNLSPSIIRDEKGLRRSSDQVREVLAKTAHDLGAATFYIQ